MGEYRDSFNDIHELEVMAGTELRKTWYETLFSAGYGFDRKTLTTKPVIFPNPDSVSGVHFLFTLIHRKSRNF